MGVNHSTTMPPYVALSLTSSDVGLENRLGIKSVHRVYEEEVSWMRVTEGEEWL